MMEQLTYSGKLTIEDVVESYRMKAVDFNCKVCEYLVLKPKLCRNCGFVICDECKEKNIINCPACREKLETESLHKFSQRALTTLKINCFFKSKGCSVEIDFDCYESHLKDCEFNNIKCSNYDCNYSANKKLIKKHQKKCPEGNVICKGCNRDVKRKYYKIDEIYNTFLEKIVRKNRLIPLKLTQISDLYENAGIESDEDDENFIQEKMNGYFLELLRNGSLMNEIRNNYTVGLLKSFLKQRGCPFSESINKDSCINILLVFLYSLLKNTPFLIIYSDLTNDKMTKKLLKLNKIEKTDYISHDFLIEKYIRYKLEKKFNIKIES